MVRTIKLGTTALSNPVGSKAVADLTLKLAHCAGQNRCDLFLLPEAFLRNDEGRACREPGLVADLQGALAGVARQYGMYILAGLPVWEDGTLFNAAVLLDRAGRHAGTYRKVHPTPGELEEGIAPGDEPQVFDLDVGRIGALVCYDIGWPQEWFKLRDRGAEVICWLSAYDGGFALQAYAWLLKRYVVSSVRSTEAQFIDITGQVIAHTSDWTRLAIEELNLERRIFHAGGSWQKLQAIQQRYGDAVRVRGFSNLNVLTLEPVDDRIDMGQLLEEYELRPYEEAIARSTRLQDEARARRGQGR